MRRIRGKSSVFPAVGSDECLFPENQQMNLPLHLRSRPAPTKIDFNDFDRWVFLAISHC